MATYLDPFARWTAGRWRGVVRARRSPGSSNGFDVEAESFADAPESGLRWCIRSMACWVLAFTSPHVVFLLHLKRWNISGCT